MVLVQLSNIEVEKFDGEIDEDLWKMQVEMMIKMSSNGSKRKCDIWPGIGLGFLRTSSSLFLET